ncbi:PAS domain-containing sensor histidine kinase [uncultured Tateyamaria sp.]|uniref:PAS domain-containing sensor histidine kinase n=1 Tax=uncultured Tateyamaria sp. TaxID=455651 RepID=UPI002602D8EE|nr:PAS domain-containing sensor histidine kinase [uncultured Tateyamaria sp.]
MDYSIYDLVDAPVFVLVADDEGRPVYDFLNKVGRDRLGKGLDEIIGKAAHEVFDGRAAYSVFRHQLIAWQAGQTTCYEIALPLRDDKVWFRTSLVATHDEDGALVRMVGTSHDISAERSLLQQEVMTAAAAREVEDLVCLAAHDLRSPIGNMKSLAYLMRHDFVDHGDGKLELINMIDTLADKSLDVISETMAQVMAKSAPVKSGPFDFGGVCDDILVLLDPLREHSVSYPRITLDADYTAVQIIVRNLIDNAFKHADRDALRVEISVDQMNTRRLAICVRDHGPGFQQAPADADPATSVANGFGLMGVRRLVKARGGTVKFGAPATGEGAEVRVELPGQMIDPAPELSKVS